MLREAELLNLLCCITPSVAADMQHHPTFNWLKDEVSPFRFLQKSEHNMSIIGFNSIIKDVLEEFTKGKTTLVIHFALAR